MRAKQIVAFTAAALLLMASMAAVGAAAPGDQANSTQTSAGADNATEEGDDGESVGPGDGLPEQAADRVDRIHERIESFLNGSIDDLGSSLSDLLADGGAADRETGKPTDAGA